MVVVPYVAPKEIVVAAPPILSPVALVLKILAVPVTKIAEFRR